MGILKGPSQTTTKKSKKKKRNKTNRNILFP
jgi:hypothetical protein